LFSAVVIVASLILEIMLRGVAREAVALLIAVRLWRVVRIMHAIADTIHLEHDLKHDQADQRIQELEEVID
jgi:hypothetical protein